MKTSSINGIPSLIYDTHHMGGMKHAYPIVYTASTVPTASPEPRDYLVQSLFPAVRGSVKDKWGLEIFFHCGTNGDREGSLWPPTVWSHDYAAWTVEGKFVVAAYGLRNRMSILCESNGTNTFEKHVYSQYAYVQELLEYTNVHGREMVRICREADKATVDKVLAKAESGQLKNWVEGKYESRGKVDLLLYPEIIQEYIPGTSIRRIQPGLLEKGPVLYQGIDDLTKPVGIKEATMPRGYLIPAGLAGIAEKLRVHGIKVAGPGDAHTGERRGIHRQSADRSSKRRLYDDETRRRISPDRGQGISRGNIPGRSGPAFGGPGLLLP